MLISEVANAKTMAGKAAFWRNSLNQHFMAKGHLVVLASSGFSGCEHHIHPVASGSIGRASANLRKWNERPKRFPPWSDGYIFRPIYDRRTRCYLRGRYDKSRHENPKTFRQTIN
jgi:hypothetical protein